MLFAPLALASLALSVAGRHIPLAGRSSHDHVSRNTGNSSISNIAKRSYHSSATYFSKDDSSRDLFCGTYYESNDQMLCALNLGHMLHTAHTDPNCKRWITVAWQGRTVDVQVLDACAAGDCRNDPHHVDLSPGAFQQLCGDCNIKQLGLMRGIEWWFQGEGPQTEQPPVEPPVEEKPKWTATSTWTPEPETSTWTPEPETSTWTPSAEPSPSHLVEETSSTSMSAITSSTTSSSSPSSSASGVSGNLTTSALNSTTSSSLNSTANDTRVIGNLTASGTANITVPLPSGTAAITPDHIAHTDGNIDGNLAQINHLVATFGRIILAGVSF